MSHGPLCFKVETQTWWYPSFCYGLTGLTQIYLGSVLCTPQITHNDCIFLKGLDCFAILLIPL